MTKVLFAIDPGKKTGFAMFMWDEAAEQIEPELIYSGELDVVQFYSYMGEKFAPGSVTDNFEIVIEEFKITPQTGKLTDAPWSLELIGLTNYFAWAHGVPITKQPPSRAKNFVENPRLHALGMWHKGGAGHANDAIRHGVLYLVEKHNWRPENLLVRDES